MHADDPGVGAGGRVLQGVGHDVAVVLLPQPALGGHVRGAHQLDDGRRIVGRRGHIGRGQTRLGRRRHPGAVIERGVVEQGRQRHIADQLALVLQHQMAGVGGVADGGGVQAPFLEDPLAVFLAAGLQDRQHALLAFRQHHLVGAHAGFARRDAIEIEIDAEIALGAHLDRRAGQTSRAHVLDRDHAIGLHDFEAGFQQQFLGKGIADLHRRGFFGRVVVEFGRCHRGAVNTVAAGLGAEIDDRHVHAGGGRIEDLVGVGEADRHRIDEDVAVITGVETHLPADSGNAERIAVTADAGDDARDEMARPGMFRRAKGERIETGDRARTHCENSAQDAADARGRPLIGFDVARMVVALHLEHHGLAVADVDDARVLARPLDHPRRLRRQAAQMDARGLVGTMLVPHRRENPEFRESRHPPDQFQDALILVRLQPVAGDEFGGDLRLVS
ncbi:hypothetical protein GALL_459930 [mine drainage metagenome]|uniref:Uncharacterized protein n=1 Tax=mine drainage metagenome TaxID=410659 RepID=A0A1J5PX39_9ZZZZ